MSHWLEHIKYNMQQQLSKVYKDAKAKAPPEELKEFESWFWKIRPLLNIDGSAHRSSSPVETSGPNRCDSQPINNNNQSLKIDL